MKMQEQKKLLSDGSLGDGIDMQALGRLTRDDFMYLFGIMRSDLEPHDSDSD
jgi:hypothetical protein